MGIGRSIQCKHCGHTELVSLGSGFVSKTFIFLDEKTGYYTKFSRSCENQEDYETWWGKEYNYDDKFFRDKTVYQGRKMLILGDEGDLDEYLPILQCKKCGQKGFEFKKNGSVIHWD